MTIPRRGLVALTFAFFFALWALVAAILEPERGVVLFPGPVRVVQTWIEMLGKGFLADIAMSSGRICLGVLAAAVPAVFLGLFLGVNQRSRDAIEPVFAFIKYIPPVSLIPVLILWLGIGLPNQVALLFIGTFFYLTTMIAESVATTPQAYRDAARTLGINDRRLVWKVLVPHATPAFFEHLRVMVGIAWTYLVAAEMVAAPDGIGRRIIEAQRYLQTDRVLAGILTIGLLGIAFDGVLRLASWWTCRWRS